MENVLADDSMLDLQIDASASEALENSAWWARFIAITSLVCLALFSIVMLFAMSAGLQETLERQLQSPTS